MLQRELEGAMDFFDFHLLFLRGGSRLFTLSRNCWFNDFNEAMVQLMGELAGFAILGREFIGLCSGS